jgi:CheY-like chemotaxis protein
VPYGVLVVDADDETASLVREQLETMGYRYRVLSTGRAAEALALLEGDANLKLVLVDAALHGEPDGVDLVRAVRRGWPDLPLAARARSAADLAPLIGTPDCPFLLLAVPLDGGAVKQLLRLVLRGGTT